MIDLDYWTTPNGHKITIALKELELPYRVVAVNISAGKFLFGQTAATIGP